MGIEPCPGRNRGSGMTWFDRACPELAEGLTMTNGAGFPPEFILSYSRDGDENCWILLSLKHLTPHTLHFTVLEVTHWISRTLALPALRMRSMARAVVFFSQ